MASCSCCDDPEPGEFRLLVLLVIILVATGALLLSRPYVSQGLAWLRERDLLVPADEAFLRLPGDVGLTWQVAAVAFLVAVALLWLLSQLWSLLSPRSGHRG